MIFFYMVLMILFIWLVGMASLSVKGDRNHPFYFILGIGYAVTQTLFYLLYLLLHNGYYAFYGVALVAVVGAVFLLKNIPLIKLPSKESVKVWLVTLFLFLLIAAPYLLQGSGNYWHTASEDGFDALNAKDYLLGNIHSLNDFLPSSDAIARYKDLRGSIEDSFVYSNIAIQYSSVTFWAIFTGLYHSFDPFMLQAVFNLLLMFGGIYILLHHQLGYTLNRSLLIAASATGAHLYFGSFINMHEGTMILGAVVPYLLFSLFSYQATKSHFYLFIAVFLTLFLLITYPQPVIFFIAPFIALLLQMHFKRFLAYVLCHKPLFFLFVIGTIGLTAYGYIFVHHYMAFSASRFRSWGISLEPQMLLIYWGLAQSNITNGATHNHQIFGSMILQTVLFSISFIYVMITIYGAKLVANKFSYFKWFIGFWIVWFIGIRFIIHDSYYFYKLLYVTQFVFILFFLVAVLRIIDSHKSWIKKIGYVILGVFIGTNLFFNILSNNIVADMDYNMNPKKYASILEAKPEILKHSYLEIPKQNYKQIIDYYLRQKNIFYIKDINKADYIVIMKDAATVYNDIYITKDVVFENKAFKIIKKPTINYLSAEGGWETEIDGSPVGNFKNSPFVWMSNKFKMHFKGMSDKKYLQVCTENGWSVDVKTLKFDIDDGNQTASFLSQGDSCHFIPLRSEHPFDIILSTGEIGKKLLPFDERELNYRIGFVDFTDIPYSTAQIRFLNPFEDVVPSSLHSDSKNSVFLGNGWYAQEIPHMRWGSNNLDLIVLNTTKSILPVSMEIEPGPSVKNLPLRFQILNEDNKVVYENAIDQKRLLTFDLAIKPNQAYQVLHINILNNIEKIRGDGRLLAIKLLDIHTMGQN